MSDTNTSVAKLRAALTAGKVADRDHEFAASLLSKFDQGRLTVGMAQWVDKLLANIEAAGKVGKLPSVKGVVRLLDRARAAGLKYPKLWLQLPDKTPLRISVAGDKSRTPGWLMLTDGGGFGDGRFFGKVSPEGDLQLGRDGAEVARPMADLLKRLSDDPAKVAAEFGHLTGHCTFCALQLSDERSTAVGYGSTCAEKYGLPWGIAAAAKATKARKTVRA